MGRGRVRVRLGLRVRVGLSCVLVPLISCMFHLQCTLNIVHAEYTVLWCGAQPLNIGHSPLIYRADPGWSTVMGPRSSHVCVCVGVVLYTYKHCNTHYAPSRVEVRLRPRLRSRALPHPNVNTNTNPDRTPDLPAVLWREQSLSTP